MTYPIPGFPQYIFVYPPLIPLNQPPLPPLPVFQPPLPPLPIYQPPLPPLPVFQPPLPQIPEGKPSLPPLSKEMPSYDFLVLPVQPKPTATAKPVAKKSSKKVLKRTADFRGNAVAKTAAAADIVLQKQHKEMDAKSSSAAKPLAGTATAACTDTATSASIASAAVANSSEDDILDGLTPNAADTPATNKRRKTPSPPAMSPSTGAVPSPYVMQPAAVGASGSIFTFQLAQPKLNKAADGLPLFENLEQFFAEVGKVAAIATFKNRLEAFQNSLEPYLNQHENVVEYGAWILLQSDSDPDKEIYLKQLSFH